MSHNAVHEHDEDFMGSKKSKVFTYLKSIKGCDITSERKYIARTFNLSEKYVKRIISEYTKGTTKNLS